MRFGLKVREPESENKVKLKENLKVRAPYRSRIAAQTSKRTSKWTRSEPQSDPKVKIKVKLNAALGDMGGAGNHEPIAMSFFDKAVSDEQFPMHVHTYMSGSPLHLVRNPTFHRSSRKS